MVSLTWSEIRQVLVEDYELYQALYDVYVNYIGDVNDSIDGFLKKFKEWYENE